ncbi:lipopolysaccharide-induced tumor necrosis factor-alpha factor homolog [Centruroides sculpturatus]|uniref:lipopolysaccharide-induced tumor necrosis factor-alpha factor homolog n=1 Tax=Centruroides sculpturatus TaxID=218467 RepID=UPI000C6D1DC3|nr:lipopolysaccharide-induced tumor necrosis factor-alpha factor homolog [Centruroides sculpturatus]XP_023219695.1 lipopolysaccharide-induced tumor necrosis factor-alpha factor homolog [Centruroides sculpturatus]XP_023219696.1 lipopolysaccharide-induced tumor necrosis factor-alpha factor homolog [Centruroides sculpturatus]XP_023219697.1 lipopolysaccharide-induced tumor necrosis factor-alpha factor homolog [Centruroides sculpturatus]
MAYVGNSPSVIVQQPVFRDTPVQTLCPNCRNTVVTSTVKESGGCTYLAAFAVCLICCPCFWIPLVIDTCKDTIHTCPNCNSTLGISKAL